MPYTYLVVDNCSTDGTNEWLNTWDHPYQTLTRNRYPGYAANLGWAQAPEDATHLHRADNDFVFLKDWCEEVKRIFENPKIGQLGLRTDEEERFVRDNTGGNCVIRRDLWDAGLRYDERPWPELRDEIGSRSHRGLPLLPSGEEDGLHLDAREAPLHPPDLLGVGGRPVLRADMARSRHRPLLSVVLPTITGREHWLARAVASIRRDGPWSRVPDLRERAAPAESPGTRGSRRRPASTSCSSRTTWRPTPAGSTREQRPWGRDYPLPPLAQY